MRRKQRRRLYARSEGLVYDLEKRRKQQCAEAPFYPPFLGVLPMYEFSDTSIRGRGWKNTEKNWRTEITREQLEASVSERAKLNFNFIPRYLTAYPLVCRDYM